MVERKLQNRTSVPGTPLAPRPSGPAPLRNQPAPTAHRATPPAMDRRPHASFAAEEQPLDLMTPPQIPEDADHPARRRDATLMRTLVEHAIQKLRLPNQELWREEIEQLWAQAVPPELTSVLRPGKWERGVLYLYVSSNTRLFEIQRTHLRGIETRLRLHFGATRLKQVRLLLDPDGPPQA